MSGSEEECGGAVRPDWRPSALRWVLRAPKIRETPSAALFGPAGSLSTDAPREKIVGHGHGENRFAAGRRFRDRIDKGGPCFGIVIDHLLSERLLPGQLVRPFGIADKASVAIAVQPGAIAAVFFRDQFRAAPPGLAELLFLSGMHPPPIKRNEHRSLLSAPPYRRRPVRPPQRDVASSAFEARRARESAYGTFDLSRDFQQSGFVAKGCSQLNTDRQSLDRPMQRQRDRRLSGRVVQAREAPKGTEMLAIRLGIVAVRIQVSQGDRRLQKSRAQDQIVSLEERLYLPTDGVNMMDSSCVQFRAQRPANRSQAIGESLNALGAKFNAHGFGPGVDRVGDVGKNQRIGRSRELRSVEFGTHRLYFMSQRRQKLGAAPHGFVTFGVHGATTDRLQNDRDAQGLRVCRNRIDKMP